MLAEYTIRSTTHIEVKVTGREPDREIPSDAAIALFTVYFVLATIAMFLALTASALKQKREIAATQSPDQLPCQNCQFFKENQYLRCAVQPTIVLTDQAIDCQDYEPLNKPDI